MKIGLNNNQLKIIAMVAMTLDQRGVTLLPQCLWLRIVGRLAFPIYASMVAEGCFYSRRPLRYLASMGAMALVCQIVYFVAMGSLYQCILVSFTMSIGLVLLGENARKKGGIFAWALALGAIAGAYFVCAVLPGLLPNTDFHVDYGFIGVAMPVVLYFCRGKKEKLLFATVILILLALDSHPVQWAGLAAVPLLALYNGQRGSKKMKWIFYLYYPVHLVIIQMIAWL